jgi:uncharacterized protein
VNPLAHTYRAVHSHLLEYPRLAVTVFLFVWVCIASGMYRLDLDLSFRPFFVSSKAETQKTKTFETVFGQPSGAFAHVLIEADNVYAPDFLRGLDALSRSLEGIPGITEVISLTTQTSPVFEDGRLRLDPLLPSLLLADDQTLAKEARRLRASGSLAGQLVSPDGRFALIAARFSAPMDDLGERRKVLSELVDRAEQFKPCGSRLRFTGVSVVEAAYADHILRDQVIATALTTLTLLVLLWLLLPQWRSVIVCLLPVGITVPAVLGMMGWAGEPLTAINSVIPAVTLVVGVADAVHMVVVWLRRRVAGENGELAILDMLTDTGQACALTTVTTAAGFLALTAARLPVIHNFGIVAACGVLLAWLSNQVMIPWLLSRLPSGPHAARGRVNSWVDRGIACSTHVAVNRPGVVLVSSAALFTLCVCMLPRLETDQRFNEELAADHPVRQAQTLFEQQFGGFLGPELSIQQRDKSGVVNADTLERLGGFADALRRFPETRTVSSIRDLLPNTLDASNVRPFLDELRKVPAYRHQVQQRVSPQGDGLAVLVRTTDMGTRRALSYRDEVLAAAATSFGPEYEVELVGQWWLAQQGMRMILGDMLRSLATALLVVLPILALAVRNWRLFIAGTAANVLPLVVPLAFMAAAGITVRIGTAVVMAIAFGIAVDNTLHVVARLKALSRGDEGSLRHVEMMMTGTGRAVIYSTLALVAGFLSMMTNQLLAIRDMGLVAAVTFVSCLLADLLLLPAIYVLLARSVSAGRPACTSR